MSNGKSVADLVNFIDAGLKRGWFPRSTAIAMKSAVERVLGDLDAAEKLDVENIDIDDAIVRFHNRNSKISAASINTYRSRITKSREQFLKWKTDPNWKPSSSGRSTARTNSKSTEDRSPRRRTVESSRPQLDNIVESVRGLSYPFPLRNDVTVTITNLPRDLKSAECDRLIAFLRSLASDFDPSKNPAR